MFEPGYYKTNYRAVRLREMIRWHGRYRGFWAWLKSRFKPMSGSGRWMPGLWAKNECEPDDLSPNFWQATKPHRADFERLGFAQCHLSKAAKKSDKIIDPSVRDSGGIFYLDPTRCYFGQLIYSQHYIPEKNTIFNHIVLAFTAVFEGRSFSCTNSRLTFDSATGGEVIRMKTYDVAEIYNRFREELHRRVEKPRPFVDVDAVRQWFDERQIKNFEDHVRRGLFVRMTEPEVAAAWAERQRYPAGSPPPLPRRKFRLELMPTTLALILIAVLFVHRRQPRPESPVAIDGNTIHYHGQQFQMRLPYASYEDYKDDPNNLDTSDLARIEQAMEAVKIPASFKNGKGFIDFLFDLKFPGYGIGGIGTNIQTDDGSTFEAESVEIPQSNKERVVVVRSEGGGTLKLADDFIFDNAATNSISRVRLEHRQLEYFDAGGRLFRKKAI